MLGETVLFQGPYSVSSQFLLGLEAAVINGLPLCPSIFGTTEFGSYSRAGQADRGKPPGYYYFWSPA